MRGYSEQPCLKASKEVWEHFLKIKQYSRLHTTHERLSVSQNYLMFYRLKRKQLCVSSKADSKW